MRDTFRQLAGDEQEGEVAGWKVGDQEKEDGRLKLLRYGRHGEGNCMDTWTHSHRRKAQGDGQEWT